MPDYYVVPTSALASTADAIREKLGTEEEIEFTQDGFKDAVDLISTGGAFNSNIEAGTFEVASNISTTVSGVIVSIGFSGHPDILYCWYDKQDFIDRETYTGGWWRFALIKNNISALSTVPYIRQNASKDVQSIYSNNVPYIRIVSANITDSSDGNNMAGKAVSTMGFYNYNNANNIINSDGTIKLARYSSATTQLFAGTYHYLAITLPSGIYIPMPA